MSSSVPAVVEKGRHQISRTIVINAPASTLFEVLSHPDRHREIDGSGTVGEASTGNGRMDQGGTFTMHMKMFGMPYQITSTVTEIVPNRVVEWQHPAGHRWRYDLEPLGPDRTRVTETWDYRTARGRTFLSLVRMPQRNARGIEATLIRMAERFGT